MGNVKKSFFQVSKSTFDAIRPELEKELRDAAGIDSAVPGKAGPAGGLSNGFDSLTAVVVIETVLPTYLGKAPPAEKVICEGGYETIDAFIDDIMPKLRALCPDLVDSNPGRKTDDEI